MSITSKLHKGSPLHILATMLSSAPDKPEVRPYMNILGYVTKCEHVMDKGERETIFEIIGGELKYNAKYKTPASSIVPLQFTLKRAENETVNTNLKEAIDKILDQCYPIGAAAPAAKPVAAAAPAVAAVAAAAAPAVAAAAVKPIVAAAAVAPAAAKPVAAAAVAPAVAPAAAPAAVKPVAAAPAVAPAAAARSARIIEGDLSAGGIWGFGSHGTPNSQSIPLMNTIYTFKIGKIMYTTPPMPISVPPVYSNVNDMYAEGKATQFRNTPLLHIKANIKGNMKIFILDDTTPSDDDRELLTDHVERIIKNAKSY